MRAYFFVLSLESLSKMAFMLANSSSKLTAPTIIAGMMTVRDDSASDYGRVALLGDDHCCNNLPLQKMEISPSSSIPEWISP